MTDIVFLLLIFFMIASTLAKQLETIDIKLPQAKGKTENRSSTVVSIDEGKHFFINGEKTTKQGIRKQILSLLKQSKDRVIILKAEKSVPINEIVYIMDFANQNRIKVVLAVHNK